MKNKKRYLVLLLLLFVMVGTKVLFTAKPDNNYTQNVEFDGGKMAITFSDAEEIDGSTLWYKWNSKDINLTFSVSFENIDVTIIEESTIFVTINGENMAVTKVNSLFNDEDGAGKAVSRKTSLMDMCLQKTAHSNKCKNRSGMVESFGSQYYKNSANVFAAGTFDFVITAVSFEHTLFGREEFVLDTPTKVSVNFFKGNAAPKVELTPEVDTDETR